MRMGILISLFPVSWMLFNDVFNDVLPLSNFVFLSYNEKAMKKIICLLCATTLFACALFATSFKPNATVYVSVKSSSLKSSTGFFAKKTATVTYGDALIVLESNSKKSRVRLSSNASVTGWIPNGSLTSKKITKSGSTSVNASSNELALAGKGFSEAAEKAFKSSNTNLNYAEVDRVEKITISDSELSSFVTEGHLNRGE